MTTKHNEDAWENRELGANEEFAKKVSHETETQIDESLGLQAISIHLQKEIIDQLKILAREDGIGYQPYIRQILTRYIKEKSFKKFG